MSPAKKARKRELPGRVDPAKCPHPAKARKFLGYMTICDDCKKRMP